MNNALRWSFKWLSVAVLVLNAAACGKSEDVAKPQVQTPPPPKETVFDDMIAAKARAQQAQQATLHDKEKLDAAMKQAEDPSAVP